MRMNRSTLMFAAIMVASSFALTTTAMSATESKQVTYNSTGDLERMQLNSNASASATSTLAVNTTTAANTAPTVLQGNSSTAKIVEFKDSNGATAMTLSGTVAGGDLRLVSNAAIVLTPSAPHSLDTSVADANSRLVSYTGDGRNVGGVFKGPGGWYPELAGINRMGNGNAFAVAAGKAIPRGGRVNAIGPTTLKACSCYIINYDIDGYVSGTAPYSGTSLYWWLSYTGTNTDEPFISYPKRLGPAYDADNDPMASSPFLNKVHFKKLFCNVDAVDTTMTLRAALGAVGAAAISPSANADTAPGLTAAIAATPMTVAGTLNVDEHYEYVGSPATGVSPACDAI